MTEHNHAPEAGAAPEAASTQEAATGHGNHTVETPAERVPARVINETIRYTAFTAFKKTGTYAGMHGSAAARNATDAATQAFASAEFSNLIAELATEDVTLRGAYDVSGLRADADLMLWFHAPTAEAIQDAIRRFGRTLFGGAFDVVFSAMGIHRPAEFNKSHVPAFMAGAEARDWLCFYPFVRSYEWYLLPDEERKQMLFEHGMAGRPFKGILSNTVASFALGDYEWLLALESNDLHEIVDMMRELRATAARRHVREEVPFYTGRKLDINSIGEHFA